MLPDPDELAVRFARRGREELAQRLLASLILGQEPDGWNRPHQVTPQGHDFLARLDLFCFGSPWPACETFVDEFELKTLDPAKPSGWPDYATLSSDRLLLIELKAERASHRHGQLDYYFALARHHYPALQLDQVYLTPRMTITDPQAPSGARFAHLSWHDTAGLIRSTWGADRHADHVREALLDLIEDIETNQGRTKPDPAPVAASGQPADDDVDLGDPMASARATLSDHKQRGLDLTFDGPEAMETTRLKLAERLAGDPDIGDHVRVWTWRQATSTGSALTAAGQATGYELRLSFYA